jgi:large subunit ribosomal protein L15
MPLQRRLPKRGFTNPFKIEYQIVNIKDLNSFALHAVVTLALLQTTGKIKSLTKPVKILGDGELTVALTVQADKFSQVARQKIIAAGGSAEERSA